MHEYAHAMDSGDEAAWVDCFTADAVFDVVEVVGGRRVHREEGRGDLARYVAGYPKPPTFRKHVVVDPLVDVTGDEASVAAYWLLLERHDGDGTPVVAAFGRYRDRLVRSRRRAVAHRRPLRRGRGHDRRGTRPDRRGRPAMSGAVAVRPLEPFGVELDLDLSEPLSPAAAAVLTDAFARHDLVLVRGQDLTLDQQIAVCGRLGPVLLSDSGLMSRDTLIGLAGVELCFHSDYGYSPEPLLGDLAAGHRRRRRRDLHPLRQRTGGLGRPSTRRRRRSWPTCRRCRCSAPASTPATARRSWIPGCRAPSTRSRARTSRPAAASCSRPR